MAEKHTGGMLALVPDERAALAVPGGEVPGELHLTLLYLGDDISGWPAGQAERLRELIAASAPGLDPVEARIMGHAVFNPDGGLDGDRDPVAVYLVGDTPGLEPLRKWAQWTMTTGDDYATPPQQHAPTIYHVSAKYGGRVDELSYTGPVRFGTLRLALAGDVLDVPLGRQEEPVIEAKAITFTPPQAIRDIVLEADELRGNATAAAVIEGKALDGMGIAWVAANCGEVGQEWAANVMRRAAEVETKTEGLHMGRVANNGPKLGGIKAMSPDPRAARLRTYWAHGAGRKKWHNFRSLRRQLCKYVKSPRVLNGLTANVFKLATGIYPGQRSRGGREDKSLASQSLAAAAAQTAGAGSIFPAQFAVDCFALIAPATEFKSDRGGPFVAADAQFVALGNNMISIVQRLPERKSALDADASTAIHHPARGDVYLTPSMLWAETKAAAARDDTAPLILSLGDRFEVVGPDAVPYLAEVSDVVEFKALRDRADQLFPDDAMRNTCQVSDGHVYDSVASFVLSTCPKSMPVNDVDIGEKSLRPWQLGTGSDVQGDVTSPPSVVQATVAARAVLSVAPPDGADFGHEHKAILQAATDETDLHDGVDDWGGAFDEDWVDGYLAELGSGAWDDEPVESSDPRAETARLAELGMRLIADAGPPDEAAVLDAINLFDVPVGGQ